MKIFDPRRFLLALALGSGSAACGAQTPPEWAYPVNPPGFRPAPDDGTLRRVPGSSATFTLTQLRDRFFSPVWHPEDHAPQPLFRQLYDFKHGARAGAGSALMKPTVENLAVEDMIALAAYAASPAP